MANPHRGEVELVAGEQTYTLRMSINEIVHLETLLDLDVESIGKLLANKKPRLGPWRAALWASLQHNHKGTTLEDAGEIIGLATFATVMEKVGEALQAAFPTADGAENPPTASPADGTGQNSA